MAALRDRVGAQRDISVVQTDLPDNDFTTLYRMLNDNLASYLRDDLNIFASAIGQSFYERLFPRASVTLGWSSSAVHQLNRTPVQMPDSYHHQLSTAESVQTAYAQQAAEDWMRFLALRSVELAPFSADPGCTGLVVEQVDMLEALKPIWNDFARDGNATGFGQRWAVLFRGVMDPSLARAIAPSRLALFMDGLQTGLAVCFATVPEPMPMSPTRLVLAKDEVG